MKPKFNKRHIQRCSEQINKNTFFDTENDAYLEPLNALLIWHIVNEALQPEDKE